MHRRTFPAVATLALVAGLLLMSGTARAALLFTNGRPLAPAIGYAPRTTSYLLVWAEDRGLGTGLDLYAAQVTSSGVVIGGLVPLVIEPQDQSDPALAWSERLDSFLVVYTQTAGAPPGPTAGLPTPGAPGTPGITPPPFPTPPGPPPIPLVRAPAGEWLWPGESQRWTVGQPPPPPPPFPTPGPSPTAVNTAVPPPAGTPTATPPGGMPPPPPAAPGQRDIYGVWASESGIRISNTFPLIASPADDTFPSLTYRAAGRFDEYALVWREVTGVTATLSGIRLTGFGPYLAFTSGKSTIATGGDHGRPSVALEASGEYLVVWSQTPAGVGQRDIFARRLNSNAWPRGRPITIASGAEDQVYPSVASIGAQGGYLVAWEQRAAGQPPDIRMRRLNRNGIPLRSSYNVAGGPPFSFAPNLPSTDRPTRLLVWVDRNAASDHAILGVEITRDGRPIGPQRLLVQGGAGPGAVTPVRPPPAFPTMPPLPPFPPVP